MMIEAFDIDAVVRAGRQVIATEANALLAMQDALGPSFHASIALILGCSGRIVTAGVGKSGHIARKIASTLASSGTPAFFVHPGEASHGDLGMIRDSDLLLAVSNSGETRELLEILPTLRRRGNRTIALTGRPRSRLASLADVVLDVSVAAEACPLGLVPTASTTAALVMGDALAMTLLRLRGFTEDDFARAHPAVGDMQPKLLTIADLMHCADSLPAVQPQAFLSQAVLEMSRKRLGITAIVDSDSRLLGVFTDGDLRRALDDLGNDLRSTPVERVMTRSPKTIAPDQLAVDAARMMEQHSIRSLVVVDADRRVVGALNMHDLLLARVI
jgi:arabinose-5-phosphate isomerase